MRILLVRLMLMLLFFELCVGVGSLDARAQTTPTAIDNAGDFVALSEDGRVLLTRLPEAFFVRAIPDGTPRRVVEQLGDNRIGEIGLSPTSDRIIVRGLPTGTPASLQATRRWWTIPVSGGPAVAISDPVFLSTYAAFTITPNGRHAILSVADLVGSTATTGLLVGTMDGSQPALRLARNTGESACRWIISPDSQFVLVWYATSCDTNGTVLTAANTRVLRYALPTRDSNGTLVEDSAGATWTYGTHVWANDGRTLVHMRNGELRSLDVPANGGRLLSPTGQTYGMADMLLAVTADGQRAVWIDTTSGRAYSTPLSGPNIATVELSAGLTPLRNGLRIVAGQITPSGAHVIFYATNGAFALATSGNQQPLLLDPATTSPETRYPGTVWGDRLIIRDSNVLWAIPVATGSASRRILLVSPNTDQPDLSVSPDHRWLGITQKLMDRRDVYSVSATDPLQWIRNETHAIPRFASLIWSGAGSGLSTYRAATQSAFVSNQYDRQVYLIQLGTGPVSGRLAPGCQNAGGSGSIPTPLSAEYLLYLPTLGNCAASVTSP